MKKALYLILITTGCGYFLSCGGGGSEKRRPAAPTPESPKSAASDPLTYDPKRGEGRFNEGNVTLNSLDATMAAKGEAISGTKCFSCHKITGERLVGPGWKGVTERRTPVWIMNFITNPDPMITKDPELQSQLEICLVRMPNQNLNDDDARQVLEFMRKNDVNK